MSSNMVRFLGIQDETTAAAETVASPNALTSSQEATASATAAPATYDQAAAQTAVALVNSLKTKYNQAQVDIAALRAHIVTLETALRNAGVIQ
jgi:hypothetical protein